MKKKPEKQESHKQLNKDIEYSEELADAEDREAQARAEAANRRVNSEKI